MGLVLNLKNKFNNWVNRTLAELCSAYIKQLARQTTKRRNSSLLTESLQNSLTLVNQSSIIATSSQDISKKTTTKTSEEIVSDISRWALDKLDSTTTVGDKMALYSEFDDWIDPQDDDLEITSLKFKNNDENFS
tara:strand:+ start:136 stop:537 length:402 start_codon:yes stop_codon:yes gene_type:complete